MAELVIATETPLSVELGIFGGRGCIAMGFAHKQIKYGYCLGIDPWSSQASLEGENTVENDKWWTEVDYKGVHGRFVGSVLALDLWEQVRWIHGTSEWASNLFMSFRSDIQTRIGVMHQDSNHSEKISCQEVEVWSPYLEKDGYWILDDADWHSTQRALEMLSNKFSLVEDHGSWVVFKNDKVKSNEIHDSIHHE